MGTKSNRHFTKFVQNSPVIPNIFFCLKTQFFCSSYLKRSYDNASFLNSCQSPDETAAVSVASQVRYVTLYEIAPAGFVFEASSVRVLPYPRGFC